MNNYGWCNAVGETTCFCQSVFDAPLIMQHMGEHTEVLKKEKKLLEQKTMNIGSSFKEVDVPLEERNEWKAPWEAETRKKEPVHKVPKAKESNSNVESLNAESDNKVKEMVEKDNLENKKKQDNTNPWTIARKMTRKMMKK